MFLGVILLVSALPIISRAVPPAEAKFWYGCAVDEDCVLIQGVCSKVGVNKLYQQGATDYYTRQRKATKCSDAFWRPKSNAVRCRLEACEAVVDN